MAKNIIITGATGMVGKGVLLECLESAQIDTIYLINRSLIDIDNPKIKEILLPNFMHISSIKDQLSDVDACFHCMGVSSVGMTEEEFSKPTFEITAKLADLCFELNPQMTFNYVSGAGTDGLEKGRTMWARVKGKTENYILNKAFAKAYMFRPGFIIPEKGIKSRTKLYQSIYNVMRPFFPILRKMQGVTTTTKIGQVMINTMINPVQELVYLENKHINAMIK